MTVVPASYLVLPQPRDPTVVGLQLKVRKIALRQLLTFPVARLSPRLRRPVTAARRVITTVLKTQPRALMDALGQVDVLTPLLVVDVGPDRVGLEADPLFEAAIPALMAALSHRARAVVPETLLWDQPLTHLADASGYRCLRFDPAARGVLLDPLGLEVALHDEYKQRLPRAPEVPEPRQGMSSERPFHSLHKDLPRLQLSTYDSNPLSMFEAHPDKDGNAISLGDRSFGEWQQALHEALELIRVALPSWFEEVRHTMRRLVPVGYLPERHLSASYREAPGVAYLTLCDNPLTIAEAIVHEAQHTKANLLSWVDPIVHNAHTCWTESPVRPDLRPLWGVLLAVHAFVPVAALHHSLAALDHPITHTKRFPRRRAEVLAVNHDGMKAVLDNAEASPLGRRLIDEMNHLHEYLRTSAPPPPPGMEINPEALPPG